MRALILGWFSHRDCRATAGDVLAGEAVAAWMAEIGVPCDVLTAPPFTFGLDEETARARDYSHVVVVCGPYEPGCPHAALLQHFAGAVKIGIGLSVIGKPADVMADFDYFLERDSERASRPDLVFASPFRPVPVTGLLLVHPQGEYRERQRHTSVDTIVREFLAATPAAVVPIDTLLDGAHALKSPAEVESLIARMDVIVSTRLHGLVMGLKHHVPVIAIDPIQGGAKVKAQADALGWPAIFTPETLSQDGLRGAFDWCLSPAARRSIDAANQAAGGGIGRMKDEVMALFPPPARPAPAAPPAIRAGSRPFLSAVVLTRNAAGRLGRCLQSIAASGCADEIVVCVDRSSRDETMEIARRFTPRVHVLSTQGYIESCLSEMASLASGEFVLRLDDDECLAGDWDRAALQALVEQQGLTHFWLPRYWMAPPGDRFLSSEPWFPDFQLRLFRNHPERITWPAAIHDPMAVQGRGLGLAGRWIEHWNLVDRTRAEREAQCEFYRAARPAKHLSQFYLWEEQGPEFSRYRQAVGFPDVEPPAAGHAPLWAAPYRLGEEIGFGGGARGYQRSGWHEAEAWGAWTNGFRAELCLGLDRVPEAGALLSVETSAYVRARHPVLYVTVVCAGGAIAQWRIDSADAACRTAPIPASRISAGGRVALTFHIANPVSPAELNESGDGRLLGMGFRSLRITAV